MISFPFLAISFWALEEGFYEKQIGLPANALMWLIVKDNLIEMKVGREGRGSLAHYCSLSYSPDETTANNKRQLETRICVRSIYISR